MFILVLFALIPGALVGAVLLWGRANPNERGAAGLELAGATILSTAIHALLRGRISPDAVTILREGLTELTIQQLYGAVAPRGPGFPILVHALCGSGSQAVRDVVRGNLALTAFNLVFFFAVARRVLGDLPAAVFFLFCFAVSPATAHAALSAQPSVLLTTLFLVGVLAVGLYRRADATPRATRWVALALLALVACAATLTRIEALLVALPGLALLGAEHLLGAERVAAWGEATLSWLRAIPSRSRAWRWGALTLLAVAWFASAGLPNSARIAARTLHPLNPSVFSLPAALCFYLSPTVVALFLVGTVEGFRNLRRFVLLPATALVLYRSYYDGAHGWPPVFYETFRYMTGFVPICLFVALFGWRRLARAAEARGLPPGWRAGCALVAVLSVFGWPPPGYHELFLQSDRVRRVEAHLLLGRDVQREARYLLGALDRHPDCTFVTKASRASHDDGRPMQYLMVAFSRDGDTPTVEPWPTEPLDAYARRRFPGARCLRFYRGLDCNLVRGDRCGPELAGRAALEERTFPDMPFTDVEEYGEHTPEIRLGLYALP